MSEYFAQRMSFIIYVIKQGGYKSFWRNKIQQSVLFCYLSLLSIVLQIKINAYSTHI